MAVYFELKHLTVFSAATIVFPCAGEEIPLQPNERSQRPKSPEDASCWSAYAPTGYIDGLPIIPLPMMTDK